MPLMRGATGNRRGLGYEEPEEEGGEGGRGEVGGVTRRGLGHR
jgi:hypothetical protein